MDAWDWVIVIVKSLAIMLLFLAAPLVLVLLERWTLGRLQSRIGPHRVGPHGMLQTVADGLKLGIKEDLIPAGSERLIFWMAPVLMVVPAMAAWAIVPMGPKVDIGREVALVAADLNIGVLFFLAMGSLGVYGVVMSGWSSNSKYAHFGALRASSQVISYELIMGLAVLGVIIYAGTLNLSEIVARQEHVWFVVPQIVGFMLFLIASVAETNRVPFDLPEAESELVAGFHVEYSGIRWAFFFMAEYANLLLASALTTVLFLGGWNGWTVPGLEGLTGVFWFFLKTGMLVVVFLLLRGALPRFRYDQLMSFCWKILMPIGAINLVLAAALRLVWG